MIRNILFWLRKTLLGSDGHRGEGPDVTDRFSPEFASGSFVSFNIGLNISTTSVPVLENATDIRRNVFKKPFFEFFTVFSGWTGIPVFFITSMIPIIGRSAGYPTFPYQRHFVYDDFNNLFHLP